MLEALLVRLKAYLGLVVPGGWVVPIVLVDVEGMAAPLGQTFVQQKVLRRELMEDKQVLFLFQL